MRKPTISICESKDADQLRSNCEADHRLCFRYTDSTISLHFKLPAIFYDCTGRFFGGPVRKPHCRFSHDATQL